MTRINQRWLLNKRPEGMPEDNCWKWEEVDVPELKDDEFLFASDHKTYKTYCKATWNVIYEKIIDGHSKKKLSGK